MPNTSFSEIFDRAMFQFRDRSYLQLNIADRETILTRHLYAAMNDFQRVCVIDLPYDERTMMFEVELGHEEKEILALGVATYWLQSRAKNEDVLHNRLYTKDYNFFSPANLLREINNLLELTEKKFRQSIVEYSYMHSDLANLEV